MLRRMRTGLASGAAMLALASGAGAADIALVVTAGEGATEATEGLAETLSTRGYEVLERSGASRDEIIDALAEVADRLPETERLMLVFAGDTAAAGSRAWLLPGDFVGEGRIEAARQGVPLELMLDLAAEASGRSAVVIAGGPEVAEAPAEGDFLALRSGVGAPQVPQGVLVLAGPDATVLQLAADALLDATAGVDAALNAAPESVAVFGFRAPDTAFVNPAPAATPPPAERVAVEPEAEPAAPAVDAAEAAEAALALDQTERRGIQERLTVLGYNTRGIDGIFGEGTRAAIADWQRDQSLEGTGFLAGEQQRLLTALADARSAELAAAAETARRAEEEADAAFWQTTGANGGATDLRAYLERYPDGVYAGEARAALGAREAQARAEAAEGDRAAWERAEAEDRPRAYRGYLEAFPEGAFADQAQARIDALRAAPERESAERDAAAAEEALGLAQGSRALIEGQLAAIGYDVGAPEGAFDTATRRALREFQTRQGLEVTGYVNQETVQALIVASLGLR